MKKIKHNLIGFMKAFRKIHSRSSTANAYQDDKRITLKEKNILESWQLLGQNKFDEITHKLQGPILEDELAEAQRLLILGITYNNKTEFSKAIMCIEQSIQKLNLYNEESSLFTAYFNLFIGYYNAKDKSGLIRTMARLEEFSLTNIIRKILFHQCLFNYQCYFNQHTEAQKTLKFINRFREQMTDSMLMTHLISSFSFYLKIKKFGHCELILDELKNKKNFNSGASYKSLRLLLDNLVHNKPIYVYEEDFTEFPHIYQQLMTIQYLEAGQVSSALKYWSLLQAQYPDIYLNNFEYMGDTNLFSLCVKKYKPVSAESVVSIDHLSKEEALLEVLLNSKQWLSKDELYRKVWGKDWEKKDELNRLQKYISKLRKKGIKVTYKKAAYKIESVPLKKVS